MFEYLEKHCAEAYKREFDQEENVFRSLPFFVAALGLEVAIVGHIVRRFPPFEIKPYSLVLHGLLGAAGLCFVATIIFMFLAVARRQFRYPPSESAVIDWARTERSAYLTAGFPKDEVEVVLHEELLEKLAPEFAAATEHNRANNLSRLKFRSWALIALVVGLLLGVASGTIIFVNQIVSNVGAASEKLDARKEIEGQEAAQTAPASSNAPGKEASRDQSSGLRSCGICRDSGADSVGPTTGAQGVSSSESGGARDQISIHPDSRQGATMSQDEPKPETAPMAPEPASDASSPPPADNPFPQHQLLRKSEDFRNPCSDES